MKKDIKFRTNPYRDGGNYNALFAEVMRLKTLEDADLMAFARKAKKQGGLGLSKTAARASVTVILSPRGKDRMGNFSAMGHIYYMAESKSGKLTLRWYKVADRPAPHVRPARKVEQTKKTTKAKAKATKKTAKKATKKKATAKKKTTRAKSGKKPAKPAAPAETANATKAAPPAETANATSEAPPAEATATEPATV